MVVKVSVVVERDVFFSRLEENHMTPRAYATSLEFSRRGRGPACFLMGDHAVGTSILHKHVAQ